MSLVWERKTRGIEYYLLGVPIIILLIVFNIVLITWFLHLLYCMFSDSPVYVSLLEWAEHLYELVKRLIDRILSDYHCIRLEFPPIFSPLREST